VISIDHHRDSVAFGAINWVNINASSVGEMVYDYFRAVGYEPNSDVATQLYTAILTDSGRFRYQSTTAHTMRVAADLIEAGADPRRICDQVYFNLRPTTIKLIGRVLNTVEFHDFGRICVLTLTREMFASAGAEEFESDGLVDFTMSNKGVIAGVLLKENSASGTKVSLRSSNGVNVAAIAAEYGGGGHFNAAGCTMPRTLSDARVEIIRRLTEELNARS
jgi:phosphoesterase RecJ-like protein